MKSNRNTYEYQNYNEGGSGYQNNSYGRRGRGQNYNQEKERNSSNFRKNERGIGRGSPNKQGSYNSSNYGRNGIGRGNSNKQECEEVKYSRYQQSDSERFNNSHRTFERNSDLNPEYQAFNYSGYQQNDSEGFNNSHRTFKKSTELNPECEEFKYSGNQQSYSEERFNNSHKTFEKSSQLDKRSGELNSSFENFRGPNDRFQEENSKYEDLMTFPKDLNSKEVSNKNDKYSHQRETFSEDRIVNSTLNYDKDEQSVPNIRFMREKDFVQEVLGGKITAGTMNSANSNTSILSVVENPIPLPRTSVNNNFNGARKKMKSISDKDHSDNWFCMDCEKVILKSKDPHMTGNSGHKILSIDKAIQELKEKEQNKILTAIEEANAQLQSQIQTKDIIQIYDDSISPCLSNVFNELKRSNTTNTDKLHNIRESGTKIMSDYSVDITDMLKFMSFHNTSSDIITQNQKLLSDLKQNSFWLIFSWFKISIGLIIQSGIKVFACMKSPKSSYAPFDLTGDRLRLFSFKREITPSKRAMILPFEPINSLFNNEDAKCFLVMTSGKEEGLVTMRINKETFWGKQFISLCLGNFGPSLRKTCFFRSCLKGKPGHHVWGGDYSKNDGSGGDSFLPCNEPLRKNPMPIVRGLIASRYGSSDKSTIFRIFIKGEQTASTDNATKESFCFGQVEEGMETLEFISNQSDITQAVIKDGGCFLVLK